MTQTSTTTTDPTPATSTAQTTATRTSTWDLDPTHSSVGFSVRHLMIATVRGRFRDAAAVLTLDAEDPTRTSLDVQIEAASIDTATPDRDAHLRSADFFDAEHHPTIRFVSTSVEPVDEERARLHGRLTIRDITRDVELDVVRVGAVVDAWGNDRIVYTAEGAIDRREFGLTWNQLLEAGGVAVSEKVRLHIEAQMVRRKDA